MGKIILLSLEGGGKDSIWCALWTSPLVKSALFWAGCNRQIVMWIPKDCFLWPYHWSVLPFVSLKSWNSGWCRVVLPLQFCCVQARKQKTHLFFISLWKVVGSAVAGVLCSSLGVPGITQLSYAIKLMLWAQLLCQIKQDKRKQLLVPSWR